MSENPWLPVTKRLARDVAVEDYIYDIDGRGGGRHHRPRRLAMIAALACTVLVVGAILGQAVLWTCGLRLANREQLRLADAVYRVDPRVERWTNQKLQERLEYRREAMDLIEHTIATPASSTFPYLSSLSGHPSPVVDPGPATALLLLANALDRFPARQRGHYVQAIVAVGVALDDVDLQNALQVLAELPPEIRKYLVADGASGLKHLFAGEIQFHDAARERERLQVELSAERKALDAEASALSSAIQNAKQSEHNLSVWDRRCAAIFSQYRSCLASAAQPALIP